MSILTNLFLFASLSMTQSNRDKYTSLYKWDWGLETWSDLLWFLVARRGGSPNGLGLTQTQEPKPLEIDDSGASLSAQKKDVLQQVTGQGLLHSGIPQSQSRVSFAPGAFLAMGDPFSMFSRFFLRLVMWKCSVSYGSHVCSVWLVVSAKQASIMVFTWQWLEERAGMWRGSLIYMRWLKTPAHEVMSAE